MPIIARPRRRVLPDPVELNNTITSTAYAAGSANNYNLIDSAQFYTDGNGLWKWAGTVIANVFHAILCPLTTVAYRAMFEISFYVLPANENFSTAAAYYTEADRLKKYLWLKEIHNASDSDGVDLIFMPRSARSILPGAKLQVVVRCVQMSATPPNFTELYRYHGNFINR